MVKVAVDIQNGLPTFEKVGQASQVTRKTWEGVRSAMKNSGFAFLNHKIIVNLTPADIKKGGRQFDLAIAMGIAIASG